MTVAKVMNLPTDPFPRRHSYDFAAGDLPLSKRKNYPVDFVYFFESIVKTPRDLFTDARYFPTQPGISHPKLRGGFTRALRRYLGSSGAVDLQPPCCLSVCFSSYYYLVGEGSICRIARRWDPTRRVAFVFIGAKRSESYSPPQTTLEFSKARISVKNHRLRGEN